MTARLWNRRAVVAGAALAPLAACEPVPDILIVPEAVDTGATEPVLVASNRLFEDGAFLSTRQEGLSFAQFDISVPAERVTGSVEPGVLRRGGPDLRRQFVASSGVHIGSRDAFRTALRREAVRSGSREAMIFIHGFNNTYGSGIYRTAQIRHDFDVPGIAIHYAWPSAANPLGYAYDRDSASFARDGLEELIEDIAAAGLTAVLIAHSLGSGIVMEVLRQLRIGNRDALIDQIGAVILFSPDIDVDLFRSQARRIGELPQPFVIFTSQRDRALTISARITGQQERVGNLSSAEEVAEFNVTLIDVTAFESGSGDPLNHFSGATSPAAVRILRDVAQVNDALEEGGAQQTGLLPGTILTIQNATQILLSPVDLD